MRRSLLFSGMGKETRLHHSNDQTQLPGWGFAKGFVHESWLFAITEKLPQTERLHLCVGSRREVVSLSSLSLRDFATEEKNNDFERGSELSTGTEAFSR